MKGKRIFQIVLVMLACMLSFAACGNTTELSSENTSENTVLIRSDGSIEQYITSDFNKDYYNEDDLTAFAEEQISSYNEKAGGEQVSLVSVQVKKKVVNMLLEYKTVEDFAAFNSQEADFMTVKEAKEEDRLPQTLYKTTGKETEVSLEDAKLNDNWYVLFLAGDTDIKAKEGIKYYSNAILLNQTTVKADAKKTAIIIFKA
jgi:hypothetical protein